MTYSKQTLFITAVLAVAALFWGYDAWQQYRDTSGDWPALSGGLYTEAVVRDGVSYLVPGGDVFDTNVGVDGIPALTNPSFVSVVAADNVIADDIYGIDVEVNGEHRYYPYQIMNWHEAVNDTFGGKDLLVTYCTLCGSAAVYERPAGAEFGVSGKVYNNNSLLYDKATDSLWLQLTGQAVVGTEVGKSLAVYPNAMVMKWSDWKAAYPNGEVLSTETGFTRDYTRHPYGSYETSNAMYFPINHTSPSLKNKWVVNIVHAGNETAAFAREILLGTGKQEAVVGGESLVAMYDFDLDVIRVFSAKVDGDAVTFTYDFAEKELRDVGTNSLWTAEGVAMSGAMKGERLTEVQSTTSYWVCAHSIFPSARPIGAETSSGASAETNSTTTLDINSADVVNER